MGLRPPSLGAGIPGLVVAAALLAGCGSSSSGNGVTAKGPAEIVARAKVAADAAESAHVSGSIVSGGAPITLDMDLIAGTGGRGRLSENGSSFQVIEIAGTVYVLGSPAFYAHVGGAAAPLLRGRWIKAPASGAFASLASLMDLRRLVDATLAGHGALTKGATTTVNRQQAVAVADTSQGGTLYVATTGRPFPIEVAKDGASGGKLVFDRWNEPVSLVAPANAIDLAQLRSVH
jgi:hypothetical protein